MSFAHRDRRREGISLRSPFDVPQTGLGPLPFAQAWSYLTRFLPSWGVFGDGCSGCECIVSRRTAAWLCHDESRTVLLPQGTLCVRYVAEGYSGAHRPAYGS